ncbi:hypothetical protein HEP_00534300, partial [Hepatocystis sp. ex Piliocolobus tephrosceles]
MNNNQLSIFSYILTNWNKQKQYKYIINYINKNILTTGGSKRENIRALSNVLYLYCKNMEKVSQEDVETGPIYNNPSLTISINSSNTITSDDNIIKPNYSLTNFEINNILNKLSKKKLKVDDILFFLLSLNKLKIKIKNKNLSNNLIYILNK